jgi:hypothetical protein
VGTIFLPILGGGWSVHDDRPSFWWIIAPILLYAGTNAIGPVVRDADELFRPEMAALVKGARIWLYAAMVTLFVVYQIHLHLPKPARASHLSALSPVLESHLARVCNCYYEEWRRVHGGKRPIPSVRVNLMIPTRRLRWWPWAAHLRVYADHGGLQEGILPDTEKALCWKPGNGTCGEAWKQRREVVFDSRRHEYAAPSGSLTEGQRAVVGHLNSVLSIPVPSHTGKICAVVNLDSTHNIDHTNFDRPSIARTVAASSRVLGALLHPDGVV